MMILRSLLLVIGLSLAATAIPPVSSMEPEHAARATGDDLTFVYVHGFGGVKKSPQFCENLEAFLADSGQRSRVVNYEWDSVQVDVLQAGASWIRAQEMADVEAVRFQNEVIAALEARGTPYVLVGFSVGSRVILRALEETESELGGLRGVYFLGSAMTSNTTLRSTDAFPKGMKITNYHSPSRDMVHRMAFSFMSEVPAGGRVGFDDEAVFENHAVACAHVHKTDGLSTDYSGLAEAIASLELYELGAMIPGKTKLNLRTPVSDGEDWWNKIEAVRVPREDGEWLIVDLEQHSMRPGYFRALRVDEDGKRVRIARGKNLHAILNQVGVLPGSL